MRVDDGARTHDRLDHNQELYQLSYVHRAERNVAPGRGRFTRAGRVETSLAIPLSALGPG